MTVGNINDQGGAVWTTRQWQQIFVAAGFASHAGKTQVQVPAVQIPVNHILDIGSKKTVFSLAALFPDHFQVF